MITSTEKGNRFAWYDPRRMFSTPFWSAGYDASTGSQKRRDRGSIHRTPDDMLQSPRRDRLQENARDLDRNYSIAAFAIRKHLDYVSSFSFQGTTDNRELNQLLERFMLEYARPHNCHVAARHSLPDLIRLSEACRTVDGDVGLMKLSDGRLQAIESDRIRNPKNNRQSTVEDEKNGRRWVQGVRVNQVGRALGYGVHRRDRNGNYTYQRTIQARNMWLLGYYQRLDQIRGVSPMSTAVNPFRDTFEASEYALGKMKVSQLFGIVAYREAPDDVLSRMYDEDQGQLGEYDLNLTKNSTFKTELDQGDRMEVLESRQPSSEFQAFMNWSIQSALKCLDIPFSFFDESHTNFSGNRIAWIQYEKSVRAKRRGLVNLLNNITAWRLGMALARGEITLPAGVTFQDLQWKWVADGVPWLQPREEVTADTMAIQGGFKTVGDVTMERYGRTFEDTADILSREKQLSMDLGLNLSVFEPAPIMPQDEPGATDDD